MKRPKQETKEPCPYHSDHECPKRCNSTWPKCDVCGEVFPFWNVDDMANEINGFGIWEGQYGCSDSDDTSLVKYICVKCYHRIFTDKELHLVETGIVTVQKECETCLRTSLAQECCFNRPARLQKETGIHQDNWILYYESGGSCPYVDPKNVIPVKAKPIEFLTEITKEIWCFEHNRKRELVWNDGQPYYQCPEPIHTGGCPGH